MCKAKLFVAMQTASELLKQGFYPFCTQYYKYISAALVVDSLLGLVIMAYVLLRGPLIAEIEAVLVPAVVSLSCAGSYLVASRLQPDLGHERVMNVCRTVVAESGFEAHFLPILALTGAAAMGVRLLWTHKFHGYFHAKATADLVQ
jgi:hypothetical protein